MQAEVDDFPQDILDEIEEHSAGSSKVKAEMLQAACRALLTKKDEAVTWRRQSGIEETWMGCEERYLGIDDANRTEFQGARWAKPMTMTGTVTREVDPSKTGTGEVRSNVYPRLTSRYVDAAYAKVSEIALPPNDKAFSIEPTPVPELINQTQDETPVALGQMVPGAPMDVQALRDPKPEELASAWLQPPASPASLLATPAVPSPGAPGAAGASPVPSPEQAPGVPMKIRDIAEEIVRDAKKAAGKAEKRIYDWMVEGGYRAECRKVIFDAAKLGVGVLKGPYLTIQKTKVVKKTDSGWVMMFQSKLVPAWKRISPWDFFPDKSCGENPKDGDGVFERTLMSRKQLQALVSEPEYIEDEIYKVIKEGPGRRSLDAQNPHDGQMDDDRFEVWLYQGILEREHFESLNKRLSDEDRAQQEPIDDKVRWVYVDAALVNDSVIKCSIQPLDSGDCRYHTFPWTRRDGHWAGVGVAEQCLVPQKIVTGATRAMLDNAGKSAGVQLVVDRGAVVPADGSWQIFRDKTWWMSADCDDVRKAFNVFNIPNNQAAFMAIIEYGFRLAEESTNIPLITQGQSGDTSPETFGAAQLQNNNANQLLRAVGYALDDYITEPTVNQSYELLIADPDIPDDEKGDFKINAKGTAVLVERALANQFLMQSSNLALNPATMTDPAKFFAELCRAMSLDPERIQYTKEEQDKIKNAPPPKPPQVQVAEIRSQVDMQRAKMDTDRDSTYVQAENQRTQIEYDMRMRELDAKIQLEQLKYANQHQVTIEQVKASLAETVMSLKTQKEIAMHKADQDGKVAPEAEPPGKAPAGQSFAK